MTKKVKILPTKESLLVAKLLLAKKLNLEEDARVIDEIIGTAAGNKYALLLRSVLEVI